MGKKTKEEKKAKKLTRAARLTARKGDKLMDIGDEYFASRGQPSARDQVRNEIDKRGYVNERKLIEKSRRGKTKEAAREYYNKTVHPEDRQKISEGVKAGKDALKAGDQLTTLFLGEKKKRQVGKKLNNSRVAKGIKAGAKALGLNKLF